MRILKNIGAGLLILLALLNLYILVSGKTYIWFGVKNTYLKGRSGPNIDEYNIFNNREVKAGTYIPLPNGKNYNRRNPLNAGFEHYQTIAYLVLQNDSVQYEH